MRSTPTDSRDYEHFCGLDELSEDEREAQEETRAEERLEAARDSGEYDQWFPDNMEEAPNGRR
jgi:hypothetical protein